MTLTSLICFLPQQSYARSLIKGLSPGLSVGLGRRSPLESMWRGWTGPQDSDLPRQTPSQSTRYMPGNCKHGPPSGAKGPRQAPLGKESMDSSPPVGRQNLSLRVRPQPSAQGHRAQNPAGQHAEVLLPSPQSCSEDCSLVRTQALRQPLRASSRVGFLKTVPKSHPSKTTNIRPPVFFARSGLAAEIHACF